MLTLFIESQETGCTKELAELNAYTMFVTLKQEEDKTRSEIKSPWKTLCQAKTDSQTRKLFQLSMHYSRPAMTNEYGQHISYSLNCKHRTVGDLQSEKFDQKTNLPVLIGLSHIYLFNQYL